MLNFICALSMATFALTAAGAASAGTCQDESQRAHLCCGSPTACFRAEHAEDLKTVAKYPANAAAVVRLNEAAAVTCERAAEACRDACRTVNAALFEKCRRDGELASKLRAQTREVDPKKPAPVENEGSGSTR